jgi:hypothetical protein
MKYGVLAGLVLTTASHASIDLKPMSSRCR